MNILVVHSELEFYQAAAKIVLDELAGNPRLVLGIATGNTTVGLHRELAEQSHIRSLSWEQVRTFNLDEYLGLSPENPRSCSWRTFDQLVTPLGIPRENAHIPCPDPDRAAETLSAYPAAICQAGGIDLQILGLGTNGHIGMNEPGTPWGQDMLTVALSDQTVSDKREFWGGLENVPRGGITMGIRLVMQGRRQLLCARGIDKARAIHDALRGPITEQVPASALQLHPNLTVVLDEAAASLL